MEIQSGKNDGKTHGGRIGEKGTYAPGLIQFGDRHGERDRRMLDSDKVNLILYSGFLVFGERGRGPSLLGPSCHQKFKNGIRFHSLTRRESRINRRK